MENEILQTGVLFYLERPDLNVNPELYEPVSYENWKLLKELEPSKFLLDYEDYVQLKKQQFEKEQECRKTDYLYLKSIFYSFQPNSIKDIKESLQKIISSPFFEKWVRDEDKKIADKFLVYRNF